MSKFKKVTPTITTEVVKSDTEADITGEIATRVWVKPETRKGRRGVVTYVTDQGHRTLAMIGLDERKTHQALMIEALNLLFAKHGKTPTV